MDHLNLSFQTGSMTTTLITGGTGKTGRRVAKMLTDLNRPIKIGSRTGPVRFDWNEPDTWASALEGCDSAYLAYAPDLAFPGAAEVVGRFSAAAVAAGTTRLVLLSGRGEVGAQRAEQFVIDSKASWTVVRCAFFAQNFSESTWVDAICAGRLELPGDTAEPILDANDIAEVVVQAFLHERHVGQLYELTGPRLLTFADAVREIGKRTGRDISFEKVTGPQFSAGLHAAGMPAEEASNLAQLFTEVLDGHNAYLTNGVQRVLGREPRDFAEYVNNTAQTGAWDE